MAKYILTDWEINGYDDSDFMLTYWDDEAKAMGSHMHGTTRFGGCICSKEGALPEAPKGSTGYHLCAKLNYVSEPPAPGRYEIKEQGSWLLMPTAEVVEQARLWLEEHIFQRLTALDKLLVDQPDVSDLRAGLEVRLLLDCKMQVNDTEPCNKCSGTGKWVNPRNSADKRDCFACKGSGQHVKGKLKVGGKLQFEKLTAGMYGAVVDWRSFGQFYRNGYNQPNRNNTTVQFRMSDGRMARASLEKMRLHRDYASPDSLRAKARDLSFSYQFSAASGHKFAWDTHNFAVQVGRKQEA